MCTHTQKCRSHCLLPIPEFYTQHDICVKSLQVTSLQHELRSFLLTKRKFQTANTDLWEPGYFIFCWNQTEIWIIENRMVSFALKYQFLWFVKQKWTKDHYIFSLFVSGLFAYSPYFRRCFCWKKKFVKGWCFFPLGLNVHDYDWNVWWHLNSIWSSAFCDADDFRINSAIFFLHYF